MALYYSGNAMDWVQAGILDYHLSFGRHFTYPHMLVDGEDLMVVMRATYAPAGDDSPPPDSPYGGYYKCDFSETVTSVLTSPWSRCRGVRATPHSEPDPGLESPTLNTARHLNLLTLVCVQQSQFERHLLPQGERLPAIRQRPGA